MRRARAPGLGLYSFPGGRVEFGESLHEALAREVREETGLAIDIAGLAGWREALLPLGGPVSAHFVILCFAARWRGGEVLLNEEHDDALWLEPAALSGLQTTEGLAEIAGRALDLVARP